MSLWVKIFGRTYQETTPSDLHSFVNNLTERLFILKKYEPFSMQTLLKYVFKHEKLANIDREVYFIKNNLNMNVFFRCF